jgi:hypothetical protein
LLEANRIDQETKEWIIQNYFEKAVTKPYNDNILKIILWLLSTIEKIQVEKVSKGLEKLLKDTEIRNDDVNVTNHDVEATMKVLILRTTMKICQKQETYPSWNLEYLEQDTNLDLAQTITEFQFLQSNPTLQLKETVNLTFVDKIVENALKNGAKPYIPKDQRPVRQGPSSPSSSLLSSLRFEAYEAPTIAFSKRVDPFVPMEGQSQVINTEKVNVPTVVHNGSSQQKWGPKGYNNETLPSETKPKKSENNEGEQKAKVARALFQGLESTSDS